MISFVWCKNLDRSFLHFVTNHAFDRQTDRQTDRQNSHRMQRGKRNFIIAIIHSNQQFWGCFCYQKNSCKHAVFTALHVMQTRYSEGNSVCPSVCPCVRLSVTRVNCDKTVERSVQIYIPYERTFILVFWEEEWLVGGDPFYVKFWVNRPPLERHRRFSTNNRS